MWVRRGVIILAALAVGLTLAVLLAIHTPWARGRALTWASDFVTRYNLALKADDLSYNAITRRITLRGVRLAAKGHEDRPFLIAQRIEVKLPWVIYRRRFEIDHLRSRAGSSTSIATPTTSPTSRRRRTRRPRRRRGG